VTIFVGKVVVAAAAVDREAGFLAMKKNVDP
jgi:hypothetical protein